MPTRAAPPGRWHLVVLDFDGTLADSFDWFCGVLDGVADCYGFRRVLPEEADTLRGMSAAAIVRHLDVPLWKLPLISRHMHALMARDIAAIRPFPGVPEMLAALAADGRALAVLSSNSRANVERVLGPESAGRVAHYACGASVFGKAGRLRKLLRRAGVAAAETLCIGDELRDLEAARAVGCAFGAVGWGYTTAEALRAAGPDLLFMRPAEIRAAIASRSVIAG
ncbi:HAD family hydrolase [Methylobacterium radiodurans]|uniref:HAD family hydrolase n=1 Tax=Methylobacterium radiodurans TaxID=2202828 RepID=A0A2U8W0P3_9HYPH|nr:HAD family hydrolase [Methylobacterium radiodurans]